MLKRCLVVLCLPLISSCFSPAYHKPCVKVLKNWPNQKTQQKEQVYLPKLYWWEKLKNKELTTLIHKSLNNNLDLQTSLANIEYARAQLNEIKYNWIPTLSVLAGFSQFPILGNPGATVIAYPLYIINILQLYKQQQSAKARLQAAVYAKDSARLMVIAQTSASFFTLVAQKQALSLYQKLLSQYTIYLKLVSSQNKHGIKTPDQISQVKSEIEQIKSQVAITKHNISVSENALHYLMNENPEKLQIKTNFANLNSDALIPANTPVSVLQTRPDIQEAESLLRAAHSDVNAVIANFFPAITVGAYLGEGSRVNGIHLLESYFSTPGIDLPILAQIQESKAQFKSALINYVAIIRKALRDISNDLSDYATKKQQLQRSLLAYADEKKHCYFVKQRFHHGITNYYDVSLCDIKLTQFQLLINRQKLEKMQSLVLLYQDLGGGYG